MKIIGIEKIDYTRKSDNVHVEGVKLYCGYEDQNVQGLKPEELYISSKSPSYADAVCAVTGEDVIVYYDKRGKLTSFHIE